MSGLDDGSGTTKKATVKSEKLEVSANSHSTFSTLPPTTTVGSIPSATDWNLQIASSASSFPTVPMVIHLPQKLEAGYLCQSSLNPIMSSTNLPTGIPIKVEGCPSTSGFVIENSGTTEILNNEDDSPGSSSTSNAENSTHNCGGNGGDAEGVWSADIDQAFQEALTIYPACGRRKIILSEEGKMYGRNELIARYIKIRCGKTRTRKQVSSHIQVLARKKQREQKARGTGSGVSKAEMESGAFEIRESIIRSPDGGAASDGTRLISSLSSIPVTTNGGGAPSTMASINAAAAAGLLNAANVIGGNGHLNGNGIRPGSGVGGLAAAAAAAGAWSYASGVADAGSAVLGNYYATASMGKVSDDPQLYQQFAAAALAAGGAPFSNSLASSTSSPSLQSLIPNSLLGNYAVGRPPDEEHPMEESCECTIASSKLVLCGFIAYVEPTRSNAGNAAIAASIHSNSNGGNDRVELVRIPKIFDPMEAVKLEAIQPKYPLILQELFKAGPPDGFFLAKCWANMAFNTMEENSVFFAIDSYYESAYNCDINVATKVCSFGNQVIEKVEVYSPIPVKNEQEEDGRSPNPATASSPQLYRFKLEKSPMCDYMVRFINELKKLDSPQVMNSVLENFSVLQVVTNKENNETLMVIAFIFEVSPEPESSCRIYRLVK